MIRRLKIKIIAVILGTLLFVFAAVIFALNHLVYRVSIKGTDSFMALVTESDGYHFPTVDTIMQMRGSGPFHDSEMVRGGRFFYAKVDNDGNVFDQNLDFMVGYTPDDALRYVALALNSDRNRGDAGNFVFLISEKSYGKMIVFVERSIETHLLLQLNRISFWAFGIVGMILLCLVALLAAWMVAPIKSAFDKQRRFISDASHELKTPLTIISANADVLQNEIGENPRVAHIKAQTKRMNGLVNDLLFLAKTDEGHMGNARERFNLSGAVLNTVLEFESRAFEERKIYLYNIGENLEYTGDEQQIRQLMSILIDNAIRYSDENGKIEISLNAVENRKLISVYNTGGGIAVKERGRIFERFYRADESRSRETGGYGVGLSIAKAIADVHRGKITVSGEYMKWVRFDVTL